MVFGIAIAVSLFALPAAAFERRDERGFGSFGRHGVPELDSAAAGSVAALVAAGGVLLARRRSRHR
jgi:hypothetical protein